MRSSSVNSACGGYTLTEVMAAVVIVAVLAALAMPSYNRTIEAARSQEAKGNLQQIYQGQRIYRLNNGVYWNPVEGPLPTPIDPAVVDATLKTSLKTEYYTLLSINGDALNFVAVETRDNCPSLTFQINETGVINEGTYC